MKSKVEMCDVIEAWIEVVGHPMGCAKSDSTTARGEPRGKWGRRRCMTRVEGLRWRLAVEGGASGLWQGLRGARGSHKLKRQGARVGELEPKLSCAALAAGSSTGPRVQT